MFRHIHPITFPTLPFSVAYSIHFPSSLARTSFFFQYLFLNAAARHSLHLLSFCFDIWVFFSSNGCPLRQCVKFFCGLGPPTVNIGECLPFRIESCMLSLFVPIHKCFGLTHDGLSHVWHTNCFGLSCILCIN